MRPIQHPSNNDVLAAPLGMSSDECTPLPITRAVHQSPYGGVSTVNATISYWQPTMEQMQLMAAGHPVWLHFLGTTHPPVAVGVEGDGRLEIEA